MPDLGVFDKIRNFQDYQRAEDEFQLKKKLQAQKLMQLQSGGDLPAALQIANEYAKARQNGDVQRMNDIALAAKSFDRGVMMNASGEAMPMQGYGDAVGQIAGAKAGYETQGRKNVEAVMNPIIAGREVDAKNRSDLNYKPAIQAATNTAESNAKKGSQGNDALSIISDIEMPDESGKSLLDKATGSYPAAIGASTKGFFGISDESTKANAQLKVLGNRLILNVPRMEGPQSDKDAALYRDAAGQIADPAVPAGDKAAALVQIKNIANKYANPALSPSQPVNLTKMVGGRNYIQINGEWYEQ